jgi:hypothetical protein
VSSCFCCWGGRPFSQGLCSDGGNALMWQLKKQFQVVINATKYLKWVTNTEWLGGGGMLLYIGFLGKVS